MCSMHAASRRYRLVVVLCALVAVAVVATACQPAGTPRSRVRACQVGVIGDSLTVGANQSGLREAFSRRGCTLAFSNARSGRPTSEGATLAENIARVGWMPQILVVALGTNDWDPVVFERHARRILAAAGNRPVVWVNTYKGNNLANSQSINNVLVRLQIERSGLAGGGNLWVWDHYGFVAANRGVLAGDRVHLSGGGYRVHAANIAAAVG